MISMYLSRHTEQRQSKYLVFILVDKKIFGSVTTIHYIKVKADVPTLKGF